MIYLTNESIQLVFATKETELGATELALWAGVECALYFDCDFFRKSFLDGGARRLAVHDCFAFYSEFIFQSDFHLYSV